MNSSSSKRFVLYKQGASNFSGGLRPVPFFGKKVSPYVFYPGVTLAGLYPAAKLGQQIARWTTPQTATLNGMAPEAYAAKLRNTPLYSTSIEKFETGDDGSPAGLVSVASSHTDDWRDAMADNAPLM